MSLPPTLIDKQKTPYSRNTRFDNGEIGPKPGTVKFGSSSGTELPFTNTWSKSLTTATTNANPGVVTAPDHGLANSDTVTFTGMTGMTELNGNTYTVANRSDDTFELSGVNTSAYGTHDASTGTLTKNSGVADETVLGLGTFFEFDGTTNLLAITDKRIYDYNPASDIWRATLTLPTIPYTGNTLNGEAGKLVSFAHAAQGGGGTLTAGWYYIISNGVDEIFYWDGDISTPNHPVALLGGDGYQTSTYHIAKQVMYFKNSLILIGTTEDGNAQPKRLRWSATGLIDEHDFTTTNAGFADILDTPGDIVWSALIGDQIALYKQDAIVMMQHTGGATLFDFNTAVRGTGLIGAGALVVMEDRHIFIGKDGLHIYRGGSFVEDTGREIWDEFFTDLDIDNADNIRNAIDREKEQVTFYWPSKTAASTNADRSITYDWKENYWTIDSHQRNVTATGAAALVTTYLWSDMTDAWEDTSGSWLEFVVPGSKFTLMGSDNGYVYQVDDTNKNEDGLSITQDFHTKDYTSTDIIGADHQDRYLKFMSVVIDAKGDSVTVQYSTDEGLNFTTIGTQALTANWDRYKLDFSVTSRKIRFRLLNNTVSSRYNARMVGLRYIIRGKGQ